MRSSGILMPISSLPGKYGIGSFSKEAYEFVDFLVAAGQKIWQILPLGQTSYGDSPYQSFSTFAGNPYFIDLDKLIEEGLLKDNEVKKVNFGKNPNYIDYAQMYKVRYNVLHKAYDRFKPEGDKKYAKFEKDNKLWLDQYALYMAIKKDHDDRPWVEWEDELRLRKKKAIEEAAERLKTEVGFYKFMQYKFFSQWEELKAYANKYGILIVGDLPIYVALDSSDAWANPKLFQFDKELNPISVAGCPPDCFSEDGQLWGNPIYNWEAHKKTNYKWWTARIKMAYKMYDCIRMDHFRGFESYYAIPAYAETARVGEWEEGPKNELFDVVESKLGKMDVIVEDLGFITDAVREMVKKTGWPNMKVLQFAFNAKADSTSDYIPFVYDSNCVVYTGTHDNEPMMSYVGHMSKADKKYMADYMQLKNPTDVELVKGVVALAMASVAYRCIIPIQDYLCLGIESRINEPSTLGKNWTWRVKKSMLTKKLAREIRELTVLYGRCNKK